MKKALAAFFLLLLIGAVSHFSLMVTPAQAQCKPNNNC